MTIRKCLAVFALTSAAIHILPAKAVDKAPASSSLSYSIERKGHDIGSHLVTYTQDEDGAMAVEIDVRIRVKLAFITVYKMDHSAREIWRDGQLIELVSKTKSSDRKAAVELHAADDHFILETDKETKTAPLDVVPSSFTKKNFWINEGEKDFMLLDTLSGLTRKSRLEYEGRVTLDMNGRAIDTRYFRIMNLERDELSHEFWIDDANNLIQTHLITKHGESLIYRFEGEKKAA